MDGEDEIAEIERDLFSKLKRVKRNRAIYGRGLKQNNKNNGASFSVIHSQSTHTYKPCCNKRVFCFGKDTWQAETGDLD